MPVSVIGQTYYFSNSYMYCKVFYLNCQRCVVEKWELLFLVPVCITDVAMLFSRA